MSYTFATYQAALAALMVVPSVTDANFVAILPSIVDYAEQRLWRELDLLTTVQSQSLTCTAAARKLALSGLTNRAITVQDVNVITPVGAPSPDGGMRNQCRPVTKEFLDAVFSSSAGSTVPSYFSMLDDQTVLFGPWPDQAYLVEIVGTIRPTPLYTNTNGTFLSLYLPDLFMAASMVFASGYQKNFGSQADDPRMAMSWETQTQTLLASAKSEETRKKFQGWESSSEQLPKPAA